MEITQLLKSASVKSKLADVATRDNKPRVKALGANKSFDNQRNVKRLGKDNNVMEMKDSTKSSDKEVPSAGGNKPKNENDKKIYIDNIKTLNKTQSVKKVINTINNRGGAAALENGPKAHDENACKIGDLQLHFPKTRTKKKNDVVVSVGVEVGVGAAVAAAKMGTKKGVDAPKRRLRTLG